MISKKVISMEDAAALLEVSTRTIYRFITEKGVTAYKYNNTYYMDKKEFKKFIEKEPVKKAYKERMKALRF